MHNQEDKSGINRVAPLFSISVWQKTGLTSVSEQLGIMFGWLCVCTSGLI